MLESNLCARLIKFSLQTKKRFRQEPVSSAVKTIQYFYI